MHWFSLNCNTVAGKLHNFVPQFIQQRFCCCLHIAAQAEGDSAGIKLGDILESREIFFPHRDAQTDADHVQGALCSEFLQDEPLIFRVAPTQCAVLNGACHDTIGTVGQGYDLFGCPIHQAAHGVDLHKKWTDGICHFPRGSSFVAGENGVCHGEHSFGGGYTLMALQDDDAFTAVHDLAVCLFIPVLHGSAGGSIGALGVDQQLVQVGGVVVMRCRIQEPPPAFR